jgi:hypothetical protein
MSKAIGYLQVLQTFGNAGAMQVLPHPKERISAIFHSVWHFMQRKCFQ